VAIGWQQEVTEHGAKKTNAKAKNKKAKAEAR